MTRLPCRLALAFLPVLASGQMGPPTLSAPVLAYVFDETEGSVRPIAGVTGAAWVEESLNLGVRFDRLRVSPNRRYAVGRVAGSWVVANLEGAARLSPWSAAGDEAAFSPLGSAVAVIDRGQSSIAVWRGLPLEPTLERTVAAPAGLERVAVSDDGSLVAGIAAGQLLLLEDSPRAIAGAGGVSAAAFLPDSQDLALADARGAILLARKMSAEASPEMLREGAGEPVEALAVTLDGRKLAAVRAGAALVMDLESRAVAEVALEAQPVSLAAAGPDAFELGRTAEGDWWLLAAGGGTPRLARAARKGDR